MIEDDAQRLAGLIAGAQGRGWTDEGVEILVAEMRTWTDLEAARATAESFVRGWTKDWRPPLGLIVEQYRSEHGRNVEAEQERRQLAAPPYVRPPAGWDIARAAYEDAHGREMRPATAWEDMVEHRAPDDEVARALVAIRGTRGPTYKDVVANFGGDHPVAARALRTLEQSRLIEWQKNGRIRLLDPPAEITPLRPLAGVMRPSDTTEMPQEVHNVDAPVLNTPRPERPADAFKDAVDAIRDHLTDEEPF